MGVHLMSDNLSYFKEIVPWKSYNPQNSLSLAIACEVAYMDEADIKSIVTNDFDYPNVAFIEKKKGRDVDTQGFVMGNNRNIVIAFRGSDALQDWIANFQPIKEAGPFEKTKAHEGFQDALYPAVIQLTNAIDAFRTRRQKIWVTGHSLGGALCSLYAGMLIENGYDIFGIYNFASPRPADASFSKQLIAGVKGPHFRVVNKMDIVPHVPPEPYFTHSAPKRIILDGVKRRTDKKSWTRERLGAVKYFFDKAMNMIKIKDYHLLDASDKSYIPRLIQDLN